MTVGDTWVAFLSKTIVLAGTTVQTGTIEHEFIGGATEAICTRITSEASGTTVNACVAAVVIGGGVTTGYALTTS